MWCQRYMPRHQDLWYYVNESRSKHQSPFCTLVFKIIKRNDIVFLSEILLCFPNQASTGPVYMPLHWSPSTPPCFCSNPAPTICQGIPTLLLDTPYTLLTQILVLDCTDIPGLDLTSLTCVHTQVSRKNKTKCKEQYVCSICFYCLVDIKRHASISAYIEHVLIFIYVHIHGDVAPNFFTHETCKASKMYPKLGSQSVEDSGL